MTNKSIMRGLIAAIILVAVSIFALAVLLGGGMGLLPAKPTNVVIRVKGATPTLASGACGGLLTEVTIWCEIYNSGGDGWVNVVGSVGCGNEWNKSKRVHVGRKEAVTVEFHICVPCGIEEYYYDFQTEIEEAD